MTVEVCYSVTKVEVHGGDVWLFMRRVHQERGSVEPVVREDQLIPIPPGASEDEIMMSKMLATTSRMVNKMIEDEMKRFGPAHDPWLPLSWEEYEKLGKPTVNDVLTVTLEEKGEKTGADVEG